MVEKANTKNDEMTISDGDIEGSNNLFEEDSSNDVTKLGDEAIEGQREEEGIESLNNIFDENDSNDGNKLGDKAIGGQQDEEGINDDPKDASETDHNNVQT
jgi:hypothetical protein